MSLRRGIAYGLPIALALWIAAGLAAYLWWRP